MKIAKDFKNRVVQYCLDCGVGIEYKEINDDGTKNLTTEKERQHPMCKSIRYVHPDILKWFLSDEILPKTQHILKLEKKGKHIDMCDFDEWVAICNIFKCPEMTLEDAYNINDTLWNYEITPMEFDTNAMSRLKKYMQAKDTVCGECKAARMSCDCRNCMVKKLLDKLTHK